MAEAEFWRRVMADEGVKAVTRSIKEKVREYGEDGDKVLNFIVGCVANLYADQDRLISNLEAVKFTVLLRHVQASAVFVEDEARRNEPVKVKPT